VDADPVGDAPARLYRFRAEDWPADDELGSASLWNARKEWADRTGEQPPLDWGSAPDGPFDPRTV
jgi:hypothetical protein